jgi:hypothetical protein
MRYITMHCQKLHLTYTPTCYGVLRQILKEHGTHHFLYKTIVTYYFTSLKYILRHTHLWKLKFLVLVTTRQTKTILFTHGDAWGVELATSFMIYVEEDFEVVAYRQNIVEICRDVTH